MLVIQQCWCHESWQWSPVNWQWLAFFDGGRLPDYPVWIHHAVSRGILPYVVSMSSHICLGVKPMRPRYRWPHDGWCCPHYQNTLMLISNICVIDIAGSTLCRLEYHTLILTTSTSMPLPFSLGKMTETSAGDWQPSYTLYPFIYPPSQCEHCHMFWHFVTF